MLESRIHRGKLVSVYQFTSIATGQREAATVSWVAIGSVPPERAREFAAELAAAIDLAEEWNAERQEEGSDE